MLRGTFSLGRYFGTDIRLHLSIPALLFACLALGAGLTGSALRGMGLFSALLLALVVREGARLLAAAYNGLRVRALFVLPFGGVIALAPQPGGRETSLRGVTAAAPIANFAAGLLLLGAAYAIDQRAPMLATPWITPAYVLRSTVWLQFALGSLSLLPSGRVPSRSSLKATASGLSAGGTPAVVFMGSVLGMVLLFGGIFAGSLPLMIAGAVCLLIAQLNSAPADASATAGSALLVRDVMLTHFTVLSTSDTLGSALGRAVHSLHDVFPVVRGNQLVGSVARGTLTAHLQTEGDGYLQGLMTRTLQVVSPAEPLVDALRRAAGLGAGEFISVADGARVVGILSPQNLARAVQQVKLAEPEPDSRGNR